MKKAVKCCCSAGSTADLQLILQFLRQSIESFQPVPDPSFDPWIDLLASALIEHLLTYCIGWLHRQGP